MLFQTRYCIGRYGTCRRDLRFDGEPGDRWCRQCRSQYERTKDVARTIQQSADTTEDTQSPACKHEWEWRVSGSVCKVCGADQREALAAPTDPNQARDGED